MTFDSHIRPLTSALNISPSLNHMITWHRRLSAVSTPALVPPGPIILSVPPQVNLNDLAKKLGVGSGNLRFADEAAMLEKLKVRTGQMNCLQASVLCHYYCIIMIITVSNDEI